MRSLQRLLERFGRRPAYTVTAVVTLALGIGSTVAIFGVIHGVLLKPLPYPDPDRLMALWQTAPGLGFERVDQSPATYFTYRDDAEAFADIALWREDVAAVTGGDAPEQVEVIRVTEALFPLLGASPAAGRLFTATDVEPDGALTVVLSNAYWRSRFGGRAEAIGRSLRIDGQTHEVIGVAPKHFRVADDDASLFLPLRLDRSRAVMGQFNYRGVARLAPGFTAGQAQAEMNRLLPVAVERFPGGLELSMLEEARFGAVVRPLAEDVVGDVGAALWVVFGTVGLVLLIACANVANLFLVRAEERHREMALREALGAGRRGVIGELLSESVSLGLLGGAAGVAMAWAALRLLVRIAPRGLPRVEELGVDWIVVAFALAVSIATGVVFGLAPVLRLRRDDLASRLRDGARGGTVGRDRNRLRSLLVVTQVALALVLLVSSGLLVRSFQALRAVEPGFRDAEQLLTFRLSVPFAEVKESREAAAQLQRVVEAVAALPGVTSVSAISSRPMEDQHSSDALLVEDFPPPAGQLPAIRRYKFTAGDYATTMGQRLVAGRELTWTDIVETRPVVMVSESLAMELWRTPERALGKRIADMVPPQQNESRPTSWKEIVGVVEDVRDNGLALAPVPIVYWPLQLSGFWGEEVFVQRDMAVVVRTASGLEPEALTADVERAVWSVNPNLPLAQVMTMEALLERSLARTSFVLTMLALAAGMAVVLGSVGIYGVITYLVSQRTREIGVRMALGAQRRSVSGLMVRHGMKLTVAGVVVGLLVAAALTRLLESLLFGVTAIDPLTYAAVAAGLLLVALVANGLASLRAATIDPIRALRAE